MSVDEDDNDPVHFWTGVIAALRTVHPEVGTDTMQVLKAPGDKTTECVLGPVVNDLARMTCCGVSSAT